MNHIARQPANQNRLADGNMKLVGGDHDTARVVVQVADRPPPLITGNLDREMAAGAVFPAVAFPVITLITVRASRITTVAAVAAPTTRPSVRSVWREGS